MPQSNSLDVPHIEKTFPGDWKYVSEGGATIVFSYRGRPHAHLDGKVLRLRKKPLIAQSSNGKDVAEEPIDLQTAFQNEIVSRLLPAEHLPTLMTVPVERHWLQALSQLHNSDRPPKRRNIDQIDTSRTKAILVVDLLGGPGVLGVEIKPKWSFLPTSVFLSDATKDIKQTTCRFCMHSHLRQSRATVPRDIPYCPLDLFSAKPERVARAIECLWNTWETTGGTANTLKIFVNGHLVRPSDKHLLLGIPASSKLQIATTHCIKKSFISALLKPLLETPVLRSLCTLQRTLDSLDIEGLRKLWDLSGKPHRMGCGEPQPDIDEWKTFVDSYLSRSSHSYPEPNPADLRYHMLAYMLSATLKDCSVIVRQSGFRGILDNHPVRKATVNVIDLDVKAIERLARWEGIDKDIVTEYAKVPEKERKKCIDAFQSTTSP